MSFSCHDPFAPSTLILPVTFKQEVKETRNNNNHHNNNTNDDTE